MAASKFTVDNGNWNAGGTWSGGTVPVATDDVFVRHNVNLDVSATVHSLSFDSGTPSLTPTGAFTLTVSSGVVSTTGIVAPVVNCDLNLGTGGVIGQTSTGDLTITGVVGPAMVAAPIAHWRFDEAAGATAADGSGNARDAALVGGTSHSIGVSGGAVQFDGVSGYAQAPAFPLGGALTFSVWVSSSNPYANWNRVFDFAFGAGNSNLLLAFEGTSGLMRYDHYEGGALAGWIRCPSAFPPNQWVHVALTVAADGTTTLYWNGVPQVSGNTGTVSTQTRTNQFIGKSNWADALYAGMMDDFRIYDRELSGAEVTQITNNDLAGLAKSGTGRAILSGNNVFAGPTTVAGGALRAASTQALGVGTAAVTVQNNGALELAGGITLTGKPLTLFGTGVANNGALRNFSGDNTYSAAVTLSGPAQINADPGTTLLLPSGISGTGPLTKDGAGAVVLGAPCTYTGATVLNGGTLRLALPALVAGAALWLDGSDGSTLFKDVGGTLPVAGNGDAVALWRDKSGNNRHASQGTGTQQPGYQQGVKNGSSVVRFNGTSAFMNVDLGFLGNSQYTMFALEGRTTSDNNSRFYLGTLPGGGGNNGLHVGYRNNTTYTLAQWANDLDVGVAGFVAQDFALWANQLTGSGHFIYRNGVLLASNGNNQPLNIPTTQGQVGAGYNAGGDPFMGDLAEILIYPTESVNKLIV